MRLHFNGLLYAISYALDCVEAELIGVATGHSKRVACICAEMGKKLGMTESQLIDLSVCAVMHDNALTQYIAEEFENKGKEVKKLGIHCVLGEKNIEKFPFENDVKGGILYHHENADGTGPFGKKSEETVIYAQLIHFADTMDAKCHSAGQKRNDINNENNNANKNILTHEEWYEYDRTVKYLEDYAGTVFIPAQVELFKSVFTKQVYEDFIKADPEKYLSSVVPDKFVDYTNQQMKFIIDIFAKIIDYKSVFTRNHSLEIAQKAYIMGEYYDYGEDLRFKLYVAGALHDIGKLAISNDVLEKPDKLTDTEFVYMQNHAWYTYLILSQIEGFEDIAEWASLHHEKLNGKGYPFGKTAEELDKNARLMGCIDIYQALREQRPYKEGMTHNRAVTIMDNMSETGFIDSDIVKDIDKVFG